MSNIFYDSWGNAQGREESYRDLLHIIGSGFSCTAGWYYGEAYRQIQLKYYSQEYFFLIYLSVFVNVKEIKFFNEINKQKWFYELVWYDRIDPSDLASSLSGKCIIIYGMEYSATIRSYWQQILATITRHGTPKVHLL